MFNYVRQISFFPYKTWSEGRDAITSQDSKGADIAQVVSNVVD